MDLLVNIDVPDLEAAEGFYVAAFGLRPSRRFGRVVELSGLPVKIYLLEAEPHTVGAGYDRRRYERHWSPIHLDVVVEDLESALARALTAGAEAETEIRDSVWGRIVTLADPFGHGFCLVEFKGRGYDEIARPA
ncbi:VOC family protein [Phenylobacterium deserti]|uniref:VOC family protein n=1 Tax=Phenylobacterium deserti TaxID=1914756 RepID=A0A328AQ73_9CAUL|nr:VOC family protein [Phenylobacterium deserti]RAK56505.1 VOC family protein [Phenylobacterium deserti]